MNVKMFSLQTKEGCRNLIGLCVAVILVFSLIGGLLATNGGNVNISEIAFDVRGGVMNAQLYTPKGVSAADQVPAILVFPGGGCTNSATSGISQELARRGFVVLNVNAYGAGISENPATDDMGFDPGVFWATRGAIDALNYLRSLKYVDQSKIGLVGHSMGGLRSGGAVSADASYFTINDLLINKLTDEFGISLSYEEISKDADELAEKYLNDEELLRFNALKEEVESYFSQRVKAWFAIGSGVSVKAKAVSVGGYEVIREPQVNIGFTFGLYDETTRTKTFVFPEDAKDTIDGVTRCLQETFQTGNTPVKIATWYEVMPGYTAEEQPLSEEIGDAGAMTVGSNDNLRSAIKNRSARVLFFTSESHSRNFFSSATAANVVHFFTDTLEYNRGEIGSADSHSISYNNIVFMWRNVCNFISMLSMIMMIVALASLLIKTPFFSTCVSDCEEPVLSKKNPSFWIISVFAAAVGVWAIFYVGGKDLGFGNNIIKSSNFFPFSGNATGGISWLFWVCLANLFGVLVFSLILKKFSLGNLVSSLGIKRRFRDIMKALLAAIIVISAGYISLLIIKSLFFQTYRLWMSGFDQMSVTRVFAWLRAFIIAVPIFFLSSCFVNMGRMKDMDDKKNITICILLNIVSLFVVAVINYGYMYITKQGMLTPFFITHFPLFLFLPVTCLIARKTYRLTGSVWLGTFINAALITWSWTSMGDNSVYVGASILTRYFGL